MHRERLVVVLLYDESAISALLILYSIHLIAHVYPYARFYPHSISDNG